MQWFAGAAIAAGLLALGACAPHEPRARAVLALKGDPARGRVLYDETCAHCHRSSEGWGLTLAVYGHDGIVSTIIRGVPHSRMPSLSAWSDQQLSDVQAYIQASKK